jgi:hypothetical protein
VSRRARAPPSSFSAPSLCPSPPATCRHRRRRAKPGWRDGGGLPRLGAQSAVSVGSAVDDDGQVSPRVSGASVPDMVVVSISSVGGSRPAFCARLPDLGIHHLFPDGEAWLSVKTEPDFGHGERWQRMRIAALLKASSLQLLSRLGYFGDNPRSGSP